MQKPELSKQKVTFIILHLSDLHFKKNVCEDRPDFRKSIKQKMLAAIKAHLEKEPQLDLIAITGDIAYDGKDYQEAFVFFEQLKAIVPETSIFLPVPGNHDVDREQVNRFFSLQKNVIQENLIEQFLNDQNEIKRSISVKFRAYREFATKFNPNLYPEETDYFWVQNYDKLQVSVLGLNSAWASEGDQDRMRIALGYPQVLQALKQALYPNQIILMHHPIYNWLVEDDQASCAREIFRNNRLILNGHTHTDQALVIKNPAQSCLCLEANASYTLDKKGFIGFQFIRVEFSTDGIGARVWPYYFDERNGSIKPDYNRWETQQGRYFDLDTFIPIQPERKEIKHVFISYVKEDFCIVSMLSNELKKNGIEVWLDKEMIEPGSDWRIAIENAIRNGTCFIACFSENYCKRFINYMNEELQIAVEQLRRMPDDKIWFIPVKLSACEIPRFDIRSGKTIDSKQWVDLSNDWESGLNRIVKVIKNTKK